MSQESPVNPNLGHLNQFVDVTVAHFFNGLFAKSGRSKEAQSSAGFLLVFSSCTCLSVTKTSSSNKRSLILAMIFQNIPGLHIIDSVYSKSKQNINNNLLAWLYLGVLNYKENSSGFFLKSYGSQIECLKVKKE